jgi:hypothetical protein
MTRALMILLLASTACVRTIREPYPVPAPPCALSPAPVLPALHLTRCGDTACITKADVDTLWLFQRDVSRWAAEARACGGQPVPDSLVPAVLKTN